MTDPLIEQIKADAKEDAWGRYAISEAEGNKVIQSSYGRDGDDPAPFGHRFTLATDGTVHALVAGDMGYEATHIVIPREHILALVEDWPEMEARILADADRIAHLENELAMAEEALKSIGDSDADTDL